MRNDFYFIYVFDVFRGFVMSSRHFEFFLCFEYSTKFCCLCRHSHGLTYFWLPQFSSFQARKKEREKRPATFSPLRVRVRVFTLDGSF